MKDEMHICQKELNHLRRHHPVLLSQAVSYGCIKKAHDHLFHKQPARLIDELKNALKDATWRKQS